MQLTWQNIYCKDQDAMHRKKDKKVGIKSNLTQELFYMKIVALWKKVLGR